MKMLYLVSNVYPFMLKSYRYLKLRRVNKQMNNDIESVLYDQKQLDKRMDEVAAELTNEYNGKDPIVVSVLTGAMIFTSDMVKRMDLKLTLDLIKASSYVGAESSGNVKIEQDVKSDLKGRDVIIMEDIMDTGHTLAYLKKLFLERGANSVKIVCMLDKPETRVEDIKPDIACFTAPNAFLVGYGLDYDGHYRNLPYIGVLKKEVYSN